MADRQIGGMFEVFGQPPANIQQFLTMNVREADGVIEFLHSDLVPKNDMALRNYVKAATNIAGHKFPGYKIQLRCITSQEFENMDHGRRNEEINESTKVQADVMQLINRCAKMGASDIHIDTHATESVIRARVNGELLVMQRIPKDMGGKYISVIYNTMCDVAESMYTGTEFQDAVFSRRILPQNLSGIRVACGPAMNGPFMVLRLLYNENIELIEGVNPLTQLGYNDVQVSLLERLVAQPSGIIFIAGPTGSGKSTTLKYIISDIARNPAINFISVEDPPEYHIEGVRQMPVAVRSNDDDRDAAFGKTIRSALRSDPDRIMIGEIRDTASSIMAITCAQTGHQVWTTVHANSSFAILDRMLALLIGPKYSERQAISVLSDPSIVNGLMFQRLAPVLCEHCRLPIRDHMDRLSNMEYKSLVRSMVERNTIVDPITGIMDKKKTLEAAQDMIADSVYVVNNHPENKCPHCVNGVTGRTVISELVYTNAEILDDVFSHSSIVAKRRWNNRNKDQTLQANARKLVVAGKLDPVHAIGIVGPLEADIAERAE